MKRFARFDPTINLGHILTVVTLILPFFIWVVASNNTFDRRLSVLEQTVRILADTTISQDNRTREAIQALDSRTREADAETRTGLRRIDDKMTMLFEHFANSVVVTPVPVTPVPVAPAPASRH